MIQTNKSKERNILSNLPNDNIQKSDSSVISNEKNENKIKDNNENDLLSKSGTSMSSNREAYKNFIAKLKLDYNLKNPQVHAQTIILNTTLDKSYSELNESLCQNDINSEPKFDNYFKCQNLNNDINNTNNSNEKDLDQLNNGFILDNSSLSSNNVTTFNKNGSSNKKRNEINSINNIYEEEKRQNKGKDLENIDDIGGRTNNLSENTKKDLTINFNNNMFFLNDSNGAKQFPLNNFLNQVKKTNEDTFKNKVFISDNPFEDKYPGLNSEDNYNYEKNEFIEPNRNKMNYPNKYENYKNNEALTQEINLKPLDNKGNSIINNLSTNLNTYPENIENDQISNNKGISSFNLVNNNPSVNSSQIFENSLHEVNNNKSNEQNDIKLNENHKDFNFINNNIKDNDNPNSDINYTSKIFRNKSFPQDNNLNNEFNNENNNYNDVNENNSSTNLNLNHSSEIPVKPQNNLQSNNDYNNHFNIDNNNFNSNDNNNLKPFDRQITFNPNDLNQKNLINNNDNINPEPNYESINVISPKHNTSDINNKEKIKSESEYKFYEVSSEIIENNENEKEDKNKNNILRSLFYGLLLGSTATGLFWLRNEEARKSFLEKFKGINFESITNFFKALLHPWEFFGKIISKEKREVYLKVFGITFGKFYDFLEQYGDGFRLLGIFLFVYGFWLLIKSLIRMTINVWKKNK